MAFTIVSAAARLVSKRGNTDGRKFMIKGVTGAVVALAMGWCAFSIPAAAQTLVNIRSQDAPRYDPHSNTSSGMGHPMFMMGDTLVALDWIAPIAERFGATWREFERPIYGQFFSTFSETF